MTSNIRQNFPLSSISWFKVGGFAKNYARPSSVEELAELIKDYQEFIILGNASNVLISDGDIETLVIKLSSAFGKITQIDETEFEVGSACLDSTLASCMQEKGISGMEFLATIPGTLGGNIVMNAGCFGAEIFDIVKSVKIMEKNGKISTLKKKDIKYSYRYTDLPQDSIILSAILQGTKGNRKEIQETIDDLVSKRTEAQPQNVRTGGSTFKNPTGHSAWELIRQSGADKFTVGGANVSQKHANFLINTGSATAKDIYTLGENIRNAVFQHTSIKLEWEIKIIDNFQK